MRSPRGLRRRRLDNTATCREPEAQRLGPGSGRERLRGMTRKGMLTLDELRTAVQDGSIDTVLVAFTDMQGRLQGKRCAAEYFLDEVVGNAAEACNYLLAVDVEMNTVGGYKMSSWDSGYGDFVLQPDMATLRLLPWHEATALVLCDRQW